VLPLLYLRGLSSSDFVPALEGFLGTGSGLPAATVTRLTVQWQDEARTFAGRDLTTVDYVYLWADGIHVNVRLDEEKLCLLVMVGVRVDGTKELIALAEGYRESTGSWADLLRDCKRRGMRAPVLAVGDGALGFWSALREVFPSSASSGVGSTRSQTCCWRCPPASRWPSNSSKPPKPAGGPSTHPTSSPLSAPAPISNEANSSNAQHRPRHEPASHRRCTR
jgi:hypothetical protein